MQPLFAFSLWEIHPALVHFPIAFLLAAVALDIFVWYRERQHRPGELDSDGDPGAGLLLMAQITTGVFLVGVGFGVLAAISGLIAYVTVPIYEAGGYRVMRWHAGLELLSMAVFAWTSFLRWLDRDRLPTSAIRILGISAAILLVAGGYLGGYLVYHAGAGFIPDR